MEYRSLGNTGLRVSEIALGTVELGLDYGFRGSGHYLRPEEQEAICIVQRAVDLGINLIDTGRAYGTSEELIGKAIKGMSAPPYIASKLTVPEDACKARDSKKLHDEIFASIEASLKALQVETIDLMQIHNTNLEIVHSQEVLNCLEEARQQGKIRFIGASCSGGEEVPLAVIASNRFQTIQVAFNVLDQRMLPSVFPRAAQRGVGVLIRSAYLRGVLTSQVHAIPARLAPLKEAALAALKEVGDEVAALAELALRFCLSPPEVSSVVIGVRSVAELDSNLADAGKGSLPPETIQKLQAFAVHDEALIEPWRWRDLH